MTTTDTIAIVVGGIATVGIAIAAWQLWLAQRQAVTSFEDSVAREYRELAATLPTKALLGEALTDEEHKDHFDEFYRYFDLSNEQASLHKRKRIKRATWRFWHDGIASNLKRPAFKRAWREVCSRSDGDFSELRDYFPPDSGQNSGDAQATCHCAK